MREGQVLEASVPKGLLFFEMRDMPGPVDLSSSCIGLSDPVAYAAPTSVAMNEMSAITTTAIPRTLRILKLFLFLPLFDLWPISAQQTTPIGKGRQAPRLALPP
jgi:hypothetical protein